MNWWPWRLGLHKTRVVIHSFAVGASEDDPGGDCLFRVGEDASADVEPKVAVVGRRNGGVREDVATERGAQCTRQSPTSVCVQQLLNGAEKHWSTGLRTKLH